MKGALLVAGTHSDAGKSVVTAGICRWLQHQGAHVAPFKAQNMALNSIVTLDGAEIGRAQAVQAAAAGIEPEAAMNPILIKASGERHSQVIVMGKPYADADARSYGALKHELRPVVSQALADLRERYDVVVCEGAGSPAEINLRANDLTNMWLAGEAGLPTLLVADIDRGGGLRFAVRDARVAQPRGPVAHRRLRDQQVPRRRGDPQARTDPTSRADRAPDPRRAPFCRGPVDGRRGLTGARRESPRAAGCRRWRHAGGGGRAAALDQQLHRRRRAQR